MDENTWQTFAKDAPGLPAEVRKESREKGVWSRMHRKVRDVDIWVVAVRGYSLSAGGGTTPVAHVGVHLRPTHVTPGLPNICLRPRTPLGNFLKGHGVRWGFGPGTADARFDRTYRIYSWHPAQALPLLTERVRADTLEHADNGWWLRRGTLSVYPHHSRDKASISKDRYNAFVRLAKNLTGAPDSPPQAE
ncbi:hypothetical protein ACQEV4_22115 [Streptomyces shenzhenensis]|uniref:hypothetical protein n=1 Tax=Streptomyces shenzhenensis TaxID=943815 RepID=UPI003D93AE15